MRRRRLLAGAGMALLAGGAGLWLSASPSNQRDWQPNEAVLPLAEFAGHVVHVRNIRNTTYRSASDYTTAHYDKTFDLRRLARLWFVVTPFSSWTGAAHTFLTFGFEGPEYLAISVEARKERGETYGLVGGMFRQYELMYVVADERDALGLRSLVRGDEVYLYPIRAEPEVIRALLVSMLEQANRLRRRPEFYHTLTNNCTNSIVRHIEVLAPGRIPFSLKVVFPGYSDRLAYDLGLIDTELPFDSIHPRFRVNAAAQRFAGDSAFSQRIREAMRLVP